MKEFFSWNSPWVQKFALLTNLVILNALWLICCLPVFTAGAATAAMYHTLIRYRVEGDDAVLLPFFRGFRANFRQATGIWLVMLAILAVLGVDVLFLLGSKGNVALLCLPILLSVVVLALQPHLFGLTARFDMKGKDILRTGFSLMMLNFPASLLMLALNLLPLAMLVWDLNLFLRWSILWVGVWFALAAYVNSWFLLKIWKKHTLNTQETEENS